MAPGIHGRGNDHRGQFPRSGVLDYLQQAFLGDRKRKAGHGPFHFPTENVPPDLDNLDFHKAIDWNEVNSILEEKRRASKELLLENLHD